MRLSSCIVLDEVEIKENAIVVNAIVGWKSVIGRWARVQVTSSIPIRIRVCVSHAAA